MWHCVNLGRDGKRILYALILDCCTTADFWPREEQVGDHLRFLLLTSHANHVFWPNPK